MKKNYPMLFYAALSAGLLRLHLRRVLLQHSLRSHARMCTCAAAAARPEHPQAAGKALHVEVTEGFEHGAMAQAPNNTAIFAKLIAWTQTFQK